jgi:hypothetical protein
MLRSAAANFEIASWCFNFFKINNTLRGRQISNKMFNVEVQANLAHSFKINMRLNWSKNRYICMEIFMTVIPRNWCINKSSAYTAIQLHMTPHKSELCKNSRTMTVVLM